MAFTDLRLQHFRSYTDQSFDLSEGVNIIVGPNATGKTNLLEAVLLLARGKSYRAKDAEMVQYAEEADQELRWARIDAHEVDDSIRTVKLQCSPAGVCKKSFEIEEKTYLRLSPQKSLPVVLFEPNHLLMLSGGPELRRSYLDELAEQLVPRFGTTRRQYKRVLAQRNALLKQALKRGVTPFSPLPEDLRSQLFVWNVRLGELAGYIVRERLTLIERVNAIASGIYGTISANNNSTVEIEYISSIDVHDVHAYESLLIKKYEQSIDRDLMLGYTTAGPHRDDFQVYLNTRLSQESASRGENRTIILTLKVIELQLVEMASDIDACRPILLLDDVFSELDGKRRHALTSYLKSYQTFITTTDADVVIKHFIDSSNIIPTQPRD